MPNEVPLPRFENGRFLDAVQLNQLVDAIQALQVQVKELLDRPDPGPANEYYFAPTSLTRVSGLPPPVYSYRVWSDRQPGTELMQDRELSVAILPEAEAVLEVDSAHHTLKALGEGKGLVEVRRAGQVLLRSQVFVREITSKNSPIVHLTPDSGGNLRASERAREGGRTIHSSLDKSDWVFLRVPGDREPDPQVLRLATLNPRPTGAVILLLACKTPSAEVTIQFRFGGLINDMPATTIHRITGPSDQVFHPCLLAWNAPFDELLIAGAPVLAARIPVPAGDGT
jgi:hypothetical protein